MHSTQLEIVKFKTFPKGISVFFSQGPVGLIVSSIPDTTGDKFLMSSSMQFMSHRTIQVKEKKVRSNANVENKIVLKNSSRMHWLPQETIVFDQGRIKRELNVSISSEAEALIVEPIIFGRLAMGETELSGYFNDKIEISVGGKIAFLDKTRLAGNISEILRRPAVAGGCTATAIIIFKSKMVKSFLKNFKDYLNNYSGFSLINDNFLVARLIAPTGYELRQMLVPIITEITDKNLPKAWRL